MILYIFGALERKFKCIGWNYTEMLKYFVTYLWRNFS
jgi:hypothetical protein